jgi:hypothetical protein
MDTVRFLTDPTTPFHVIGDTIVHTGGSHSVDPKDIVIEEVCKVSSGWLVKLHNRGRGV